MSSLACSSTLALHARRRDGVCCGGSTAALAIVGVGAHEHAPPAVVGDHLVEKALGRAAEGAGSVMAITLERVILEIERHHGGMGRDRVDALFAAGAEQLQGRAAVHLRIVEL